MPLRPCFSHSPPGLPLSTVPSQYPFVLFSGYIFPRLRGKSAPVACNLSMTLICVDVPQPKLTSFTSARSQPGGGPRLSRPQRDKCMPLYRSKVASEKCRHQPMINGQPTLKKYNARQHECSDWIQTEMNAAQTLKGEVNVFWNGQYLPDQKICAARKRRMITLAFRWVQAVDLIRISFKILLPT